MNLGSLEGALSLTAVGMGIVFATLIALSLMVGVLAVAFGGKKGAKALALDDPELQELMADAPKPVGDAPSACERVGADSAQTTLIAVIATALAAYLGQAPENLNIISINRVPTAAGQWTAAARRESIQS